MYMSPSLPECARRARASSMERSHMPLLSSASSPCRSACCQCPLTASHTAALPHATAVSACQTVDANCDNSRQMRPPGLGGTCDVCTGAVKASLAGQAHACPRTQFSCRPCSKVTTRAMQSTGFIQPQGPQDLPHPHEPCISNSNSCAGRWHPWGEPACPGRARP